MPQTIPDSALSSTDFSFFRCIQFPDSSSFCIQMPSFWINLCLQPPHCLSLNLFFLCQPDLSLCTLLTLTIHLSHWLNLACFFVWAWGHFLFLIQTLFCLSVSICLCLSLDLPMTPPTLHPPKNPLSFSLSIRSTFKTKKCLDKLRLLKRKVSFYNK